MKWKFWHTHQWSKWEKVTTHYCIGTIIIQIRVTKEKVCESCGDIRIVVLKELDMCDYKREGINNVKIIKGELINED